MNPRRTLILNGFRDHHNQPLCHPSAGTMKLWLGVIYGILFKMTIFFYKNFGVFGDIALLWKLNILPNSSTQLSENEEYFCLFPMEGRVLGLCIKGFLILPCWGSQPAEECVRRGAQHLS